MELLNQIDATKGSRTNEKLRQQIVTKMIVNKANREAAGKDKPHMEPNKQRQLVRKLALVNEKIKDIGFKLDVFPEDSIDPEKIKLEKAMKKNMKERTETLKLLGFTK